MVSPITLFFNSKSVIWADKVCSFYLQKPAQAKMGQVKSGLGQNGPLFLAIIVPKWANFESFLDQKGEVEI